MALWGVAEGIEVWLYIGVVDGQLIQWTKEPEEPPDFICDMQGGGRRKAIVIMADAEALNVGQLGVIQDGASGLGQDIPLHLG